MKLKTALTYCVILGAVASVFAVLSELNHSSGTPLAWVMISRFAVVAAFAAVGAFAAAESRLTPSVALASKSPGAKLREVALYGLLPGLALGLINDVFFFQYRHSPLVAPRIREIQSFYDALLISFDTGIFEEVVYRLFILSCLVFLLEHMYRKIRLMWPTLASVLPRAMALVLSSLLFALDHSVSGFTGAFSGGMVLGLIYMKGGVESAITAHVVANFLFFSASYVMP